MLTFIPVVCILLLVQALLGLLEILPPTLRFLNGNHLAALALLLLAPALSMGLASRSRGLSLAALGLVLLFSTSRWGCVVGIDGAEKNVTWLRKDDGRKEGYADLENYHEMVMRHGDICTLLPNDIHSVHNEGDVPSVSLHIYGRSLAFTDRHEFDPEAKVVRPCPKRKRND